MNSLNLKSVTIFYKTKREFEPNCIEFEVKNIEEIGWVLDYLKVWKKGFECLGYVFN